MDILNPRLPKVMNKQTIEEVEIKILNIRDKYGNEEPTTCVEFTVVGRNSRWRDFLKVEEFTQANPDKIAELMNNT